MLNDSIFECLLLSFIPFPWQLFFVFCLFLHLASILIALSQLCNGFCSRQYMSLEAINFSSKWPSKISRLCICMLVDWHIIVTWFIYTRLEWLSLNQLCKWWYRGIPCFMWSWLMKWLEQMHKIFSFYISEARSKINKKFYFISIRECNIIWEESSERQQNVICVVLRVMSFKNNQVLTFIAHSIFWAAKCKFCTQLSRNVEVFKWTWTQKNVVALIVSSSNQSEQIECAFLLNEETMSECNLINTRLLRKEWLFVDWKSQKFEHIIIFIVSWMENACASLNVSLQCFALSF